MSLPLALYIHWPFCRSKCPYCDFNSHVRERVDQDAWRQALLAELRAMAAKISSKQRISSIFFGGGTPSLMPPGTAGALIEAAEAAFGFAEAVEITLEANPTSVEAARLADFRAAGVNRVSLGVQSLEAADLKFLGRNHSGEEALAAVEMAARIFPRYSFDLIYARPGQTLASWRAELTRALGYARGHLSLYQLTIEENTAFHPAHARGDFRLPPDDQSAEMYEMTQEIMESAGMPAYEISNHARPGEESRHNLVYWRGGDYLGIGPGAHGRLTGTGGRIATQTVKSPERWLEAVGREGHGIELWEELSPRIAWEERVMMRLRVCEEIPRNELETREFRLNENALARLAAQRVLTFTPESLTLTPKGRLVLNYVTAELIS